MLANTTRLKAGSSIASIYARDAYTARSGSATFRHLNVKSYSGLRLKCIFEATHHPSALAMHITNLL
jgi:hypothetical protein